MGAQDASSSGTDFSTEENADDVSDAYQEEGYMGYGGLFVCVLRMEKRGKTKGPANNKFVLPPHPQCKNGEAHHLYSAMLTNAGMSVGSTVVLKGNAVIVAALIIAACTPPGKSLLSMRLPMP